MRVNGKPVYHGVLDISEGQVGSYKLRHVLKEPGEEFSTTSVRTAILGGQKGKTIKYKHPTRWHELSYEGDIWMTDYPIEQEQHDQLLKNVRSGRVLVGGLGLGYAALLLVKRKKIRRVTVVEISSEVIELVEPHLRAKLSPEENAKLEIVNADLFAFLQNKNKWYSHAFYDTWQSDNEGTFFSVVVPLIQASNGIIKHRPICWNEGVMRGQLFMGLQSRIAMTIPGSPMGSPDTPSREEMSRERGDIWWDWCAPFFKETLHLSSAARQEDLFELARAYVFLYGTWGWENWWSNYVPLPVSSGLALESEG